MGRLFSERSVVTCDGCLGKKRRLFGATLEAMQGSAASAFWQEHWRLHESDSCSLRICRVPDFLPRHPASLQSLSTQVQALGDL